MPQPAPIQHQAVESSILASVSDGAEDRVLEIQFRSGAVYQYFSVPEAIYPRPHTGPSPCPTCDQKTGLKARESCERLVD